jgi:predicted nucleotidyltransferase
MIKSSQMKSKLNKFAKEHQIKFIVLFGSQAQKRPQKGSDFDIAILTTKKRSLKNLDYYSEALFGLSKILGVPDYKMDLTNLNSADHLLRHEIISKGKLLFGDETKYAAFKSFTLRDYIGTVDLRELEKKIILKRQKLLTKKIYV